MKILILTDHYPPYFRGGAELNCALVADGLQDHGHDVYILTTHYGLSKPSVSRKTYRILPFVEQSFSTNLQRRIYQLRLFFASLRTYLLTKKVVSEIHPDIAFTWNFEYHSILLSLFAFQDMRIPNLYSIRSHWPVDLKRDYVDEPNIIKKSYRSLIICLRKFQNLSLNAGIFVSHTIYENCRNAGVVFDHSTVIHNGIPDLWIKRKIKPFPPDDVQIKLLYVGRFEDAKGTDMAILALAKIVNHYQRKNVHLDLYGKGEESYLDYLNTLVEQHHLADHVNFHSLIPREQLIAEYSKFDILLFTTPKYETFGNVIIESMSQGVLVVSSSIGATRELIEDRITGFLTPANDPSRMALIVDECISSPGEVDRIRNNALEMVRDKFCSSRMINSYNEYLIDYLNFLKTSIHGL